MIRTSRPFGVGLLAGMAVLSMLAMACTGGNQQVTPPPRSSQVAEPMAETPNVVTIPPSPAVAGTAATSSSQGVTAAALARDQLWHWPMVAGYDGGYQPTEGDHVGRDLYAIDVKTHSDDRRVFPARPGVVAFAASNCQKAPGQGSCYGNVVVIDHGDGLYSLYTHLANPAPAFKPGEGVTLDTVLGTMGSTGCDGCGDHVHFVVRRGRSGIRDASVLFQDANEPVDVRPLLTSR